MFQQFGFLLFFPTFQWVMRAIKRRMLRALKRLYGEVLALLSNPTRRDGTLL
ncbi:Uncharacterised protein [Vibrio cholerae]|nr:Uncharacterised protein [Vibrio cholerae]CSC31543.1 Uncharacterised protein [Vibrio cholerae]CSI14812.1 Uncharacterised protein [Vibrio cholerae]